MKKLFILAISLVFILTGCKSNGKGSNSEYPLSKSNIDSTEVIVDTPVVEEKEETEDENEPTHVTQYCLVDVDKQIGPYFRDNSKLLKNLGFTVRTYNRPSNMDEMEDFTELVATRPGKSGVTKITQTSGEDRYCIIDFANETELAAFVESMHASGYTKSGHIYSHPKNVPGMGMIYVKVEGLKVTMISPFEMLGTNF
ncbi:MAG: hypothetical protein K2L89_04895 [Muribaculaceae bacterium]|nr:hypothetical protein [Muribaculaceae bacterium]